MFFSVGLEPEWFRAFAKNKFQGPAYSTLIWVAVKELNLTYYIGDTILNSIKVYLYI